ncbi:cobyric acid synthase [Methylobrevis albus]|uniref:Cobyric acid synthase n=1 Tax=Methylobrevis albus TaxID=2793297 RepID=A0A931HZM5_9HYPH|nr:cobyric acid synthase [Methylobrevis albus]MBH0236639.1 cobyric acid synthase [Methylobrevis albus]
MPARAVMIQGTGSDVGKSLIVAGLCRAAVRRGLRVAPFKAQNMSNNAAVTDDGGEIGRAQALQARAAGLPLSVHMNPVLLKPQSEVGAQVIVQGRRIGNSGARAYQDFKASLLPAVLESFGILKADTDLVIVEGAGSASEVNLRRNDIANMGFARAADVPVVLLGDIDRGGVIASLVGTQAVLDPADAAMIEGFIVNRFRGDPSLFDDGMRIVAGRTGWRALGLVPHFAGAVRLPAEDAMALERPAGRAGAGRLLVAVPQFARIANFDDFDALAMEPAVDLVFVRRGQPIPPADLVILPGSKATIADLADVRREGWDIDLAAHIRRGGRVLGVCGGFQMLGCRIADPDGIEGPPSMVAGLGLLDVETVMTGEKTLTKVTGRSLADDAPLSGYEMHVGRTTGPDAARPFAVIDGGGPDGAVSTDGRIVGTYLHGLFTDDVQRGAWLARLGGRAEVGYGAAVETALDELAAHLEAHMDVAGVFGLAR